MHRLRISTFFAALVLPLLLCMGQVQAQVNIDYFNFNNLTASSTYSSISHNPDGKDVGSGTLTTNFSSLTDFGGTTVNAKNSSAAGQALALVDSANNGKYLQLQTSSTGYKNLMLSFATQSTGTGFNSDQLSYSINGGTFQSFGTAFNPPAAFAGQSFDLSSISGLNDAASITLRITFNGASSGSGNNRIDNLLLQGDVTPAPPGLVSMGIGLGMAGLGTLLRRRRQVQMDVEGMVQAA